MTALTPGEPAPSFTLPSSDGRTVSLKDFRGRKVVLYFYPKDNTPGCTREACDFRDNMARVRSKGAEVVGISKDSVESHRKFAGKYDLPFPLLADEKGDVIKAYHAWKKKTMWGKSFLGIERTTVIIDEEGRIVRVFPRVRLNGHVDEVLASL